MAREGLPPIIKEAQVSAPGPLVDIEPIEVSQGQAIHTRAELEKWVEGPALAPCQELYDKNIQTVSASANRKDVQRAYIDIDEASLSEENRQQALHIGGRSFIDQAGKQRIKLSVELTGSETPDEVTAKLLAVTGQLAPQPLLWAQTYTLDSLKEHFGYMPHEIVEPAIFIGEGYFQDPHTGLFHESEELYQKSTTGR